MIRKILRLKTVLANFGRGLWAASIAKLNWRYDVAPRYTVRTEKPFYAKRSSNYLLTGQEASASAGLFEINCLWIGEKLPVVEHICLLSMLRPGPKIRLFTYQKPDNIPSGIDISDANEVIEKNEFLKYAKVNFRHPSLASNVFRYRMLQKGLGLWLDMDMLLLKPLAKTANPLFGLEPTNFIGTAALYLPAGHKLLSDLLNFTATEFPIPSFYTASSRMRLRSLKWLGRPVHAGELPWGVFGPAALTYFADRSGLTDQAAPPEIFYPISWEAAHGPLIAGWDGMDQIKPETIGIHLWSHMIRHHSPNAIQPGSFLDHYAKTQLGLRLKI